MCSSDLSEEEALLEVRQQVSDHVSERKCGQVLQGTTLVAEYLVTRPHPRKAISEIRMDNTSGSVEVDSPRCVSPSVFTTSQSPLHVACDP